MRFQSWKKKIFHDNYRINWDIKYFSKEGLAQGPAKVFNAIESSYAIMVRHDRQQSNGMYAIGGQLLKITLSWHN